MENTTPMFRQYLEIKKLYPGTLLFFRLGDFYELFSDDAVIGSRELDITLTARQKDSPNPIPMCGVPHHAAASYIAKLVRKGYRVAICEQAEPATKGVKLVRREVVRVITPGTAVDPQLIESREPIYLAAVSSNGTQFGAAFLDVSTGHFSATEFDGPDAADRLRELVESFNPRELLVPAAHHDLLRRYFASRSGVSEQPQLLPSASSSADSAGGAYTITVLDDASFSPHDCEARLKEHFGVRDLAPFGIAGHLEAARAAAACVSYAKETQREAAGHISEISYFETTDFMVLDAVTLRNLEVVDGRGDTNKKTLFSVIDETITGMGARLLRTWLVRPSIKRSEIQTRLAAVTELTDSILREKIRFLLKDVTDLERLIGRLNLGTATARDLLALNRSLERSPQITESLSDAASLLLQVLAENIFELPEIRELIDRAISPDAPINAAEGGIIRAGFDGELDDLRDISTSGKQTIAAFEDRERERTGITNLKVRFNNVFGYYIEISKGSLARVPEDYERRQTLANAERYTTPQLKEWEQKILGAEDRISQIENELFRKVREEVRLHTPKLQSTARALAALDALASLAETAVKRNYSCPVLHDGDSIEIRSGRHPVVEAYLNEAFIPNDLFMNNSTDRLLIITGANMGGKSTVLRQIALIQILGQIGSFVPAASAKLPIVDRIWTRVGASDDLASGRSTFMVEMIETATILHNSTPRSLILLDEIGRGTSTFDGLSIAWAVAEYLHDSAEHAAKTLFATHYHELTELAENLPGAQNYQITAAERDGEVVFLHKLQKGKASKSYGIAVAKLAGLPVKVIERARDVLQKLERYELAIFTDESKSGLAKAAGRAVASQLPLFAAAAENDATHDETAAVIEGADTIL
ncbi:MAG: DNA mismatch repair protein MutS [Acidobacteriota bacterium]